MVAPSCFNTRSREGARPGLVLTASVAGKPSLVLSHSLPADLDTPGCDGRSGGVVQAPGPSLVDTCPQGPSRAASPTRCARQPVSRTADRRAPRLSGVQPTWAGGLLGCVSRDPRPGQAALWLRSSPRGSLTGGRHRATSCPGGPAPGGPAPGEALVSVVTDTRAFLVVFLLEGGSLAINQPFVLVSGVRQSESVTLVHTCVSFRFFSQVATGVLSGVACTT